MELHLTPKIAKIKKPKFTGGKPIVWTCEMLDKLEKKYPITFNKVLAEELGIGWRSLVRKARELDIEKEPGFLEKRRMIISDLAQTARPDNPTKGQKGWIVPGGRTHCFKKGNIPPNKKDPKVADKIRKSRNETIRKERLRIKYGRPQKTKLKLKI